MNYQYKQNKSFLRNKAILFLLSGLVLCLVLLSACRTNTVTHPPGNATTLPTPAIDPALKNQGDMQLQTFQQWITLMQQNKGNVDTYQQQKNRQCRHAGYHRRALQRHDHLGSSSYHAHPR